LFAYKLQFYLLCSHHNNNNCPHLSTWPNNAATQADGGGSRGWEWGEGIQEEEVQDEAMQDAMEQ
jgi:hypothetical protein